jgi:hypothetical protein
VYAFLFVFIFLAFMMGLVYMGRCGCPYGNSVDDSYDLHE